MKHGDQVDPNHPFEVVEWLILGRAYMHDACIVDHDVQAAVTIKRRAHCSAKLFSVGYIRGYGCGPGTQLCGELIDSVSPARYQDHRGAVLMESSRHSRSDAGRGSRD
jgi:hypothetical protein